MAVICQLHEEDWRFAVSYLMQDDGCLYGVRTLSIKLGSMAVICQLFEVRWWLSVSDLRQVGGYLQGGFFSVCFMWLHGGYLSAT
jgi:hypothetical protein